MMSVLEMIIYTELSYPLDASVKIGDMLCKVHGIFDTKHIWQTGVRYYPMRYPLFRKSIHYLQKPTKQNTALMYLMQKNKIIIKYTYAIHLFI